MTTLLLLSGLASSSTASASQPQFESCETERFGSDARCALLTVFEDRQANHGRTIDLRIVVLPTTGDSPREPLFLLADKPQPI